MKKILFIAALATAFGIYVHGDEAAELTKNIGPGEAGKVGAGIIVGEPIGAALKYWFIDKWAIDGAAGWSSDDHTDLYVHSDILWHNFELIQVSKGRLPLYLGVSGLVRFRDDNRDNQVGVRVPVGVSYIFDNAPLDIFDEVGPAIDFAPDVCGEITGGIGIRFWF